MYEEKRPNYFWLVLILIIFLLTLGVLVYFIRVKTSITPKADNFNSNSLISISNSYVFSSPVRAKANGDLIRITVFILDDEGNGIFDKKVGIKTQDGALEIKEIQSLTDETGKAIFDVASSTVGSYNIEAFTNEAILPQKIKVVFD